MKQISVLVVEDESIIAKNIEQILKKSGYHIAKIVPSGEEAINAADDENPDLVLMDIGLKGNISGIEAAQRIREEMDIPVIFLTAYADEDIFNKAKVADPYGYILKPFKDIDLQHAIEITLQKHKKSVELKKQNELLFSIVESRHAKDMLFIRANSKLVKVKATDISYVEALKDYVIINTLQGRYTIHSTMKEIEKKFPLGDFVRVHRSYIVRLDKITSIDYPNLVLEENKTIPIGNVYRENLVKRLNMM